MSSSKAVFLLALSDDGSPDIVGNYINLPPPTAPYTLRFAIEGASSICRNGSFFINVPELQGEFDRNKFREFKLTPHFNRTIHIDVTIDRPGAFAYYIRYSPLPDFTASSSPSKPTPKPRETEKYYLTVSPNLAINSQPVALDSLSICSVVSKWLGPAKGGRWTPQLQYISRKGYNMIHFTPLQKRGDSNSPYSLADQMAFDPEAFPGGEKQVREIVVQMEKEFGLLSLTDVVWNHTAPESKWLWEHPDAGYNLVTAPWLESAYELDTALLQFSNDLETFDLPKDIETVEDLKKVMDGMKKRLFPELKLWEYYTIDAKRDLATAIEAWKAGKAENGLEGYKSDLTLFQKAILVVKSGLVGADRLGERGRRKIHPVVGAAFIRSEVGSFSSEKDVTKAKDAYKKVLDEINLPFYKEYDAELAVILEQLFNRIKYLRVDDHGPKQTSDQSLVETYFTRLPVNEVTKKHPKGALALASNGWMWNANPLVDFAGPDSRAYLRREVISWGDCVKLRYGKGPEDSPYLWEHMRKYTELMAKCFHGFRIDNCHSTPLHVGEYLLDAARRVRKDLYVVAELFTGDEYMDKVYVERLALASLIREAMQAWSTGELSRLVHRHGGRPIGSFEPESGTGLLGGVPGDTRVGKVTGSPIHALFMDCTHDNETPAQKREAKDTLPNGALVAMCDCATGSVYGYDEVYPKHLDVVNEKRNYSPAPKLKPEDAQTPEGGLEGLPMIKRILNTIHEKMTREGYEEMHVHHENEYITVHRFKPGTNNGYFLIAHTAFKGATGDERGDIKPINLPGSKVKLIGAWTMKCKDSEEDKQQVVDAKDYLKGLETEIIQLDMGEVKATVGDGNGSEIGVTSTITVPDVFPPGSIALYETWVPGSAAEAVATNGDIKVDDLDDFLVSGAKEAVGKLNLIDLNFVLYRCESEERDSSDGKDGVYNVPGIGNLVYAGLQGWWGVMEPIVERNDLGHPACQHLRDGLWAWSYLIHRIERELADNFADKGNKNERLQPLREWLQVRLDRVRRVPSWLRPRCFALVLGEAYIRCVERAVQLMHGCLVEGDGKGRRGGFLRELALCGIQMTGYMKTTSLYPKKAVPCMAAGLPHFSYDYMRCWGRDVFISVRGSYLATGRYEEAKEHLLAFASVLKHGMVPNLLDGGKKPRYNARDSIWFWLHCLQDYTRMVPGGESILKEKVKRRFLPYDDQWLDFEDPRVFSRESTIAEIVQEALQRHAWGMAFREANAGPGLDSQMRWDGFWIEIGVDWRNGFVKGGSRWNCGTWMDKNGESEIAGNKGIPGSPRDGAAVEITGMLYSTLRWVAGLHKRGVYQWDSVQTSQDGKPAIKFNDWADRIHDNFERCYYIPLDESQDSRYDIRKDFVKRRGVYKDLYGSSVLIGAVDGDQDPGREDYRLRPNFLIAMVVAPDLFKQEHALKAIEIVDKVLAGPYGMATLDPGDPNYRPNYINSADNNDFATSKGRNYHQGPEWLWPTGYFLRALLTFDLKRRSTKQEKIETFQHVTKRLENLRKMIKESPWRGLTELTNVKGAHCADSCPTQAWSAGCLVDLFYDASKVDESL